MKVTQVEMYSRAVNSRQNKELATGKPVFKGKQKIAQEVSETAVCYGERVVDDLFIVMEKISVGSEDMDPIWNGITIPINMAIGTVVLAGCLIKNIFTKKTKPID